MSDTGSFHLPPPQPHPQPPRPPQPAYEPSHALTPLPQPPLPYASPPLPPQQHATGASTASYTARDPQVPLPEQRTPGRRSHAAARRPGPPAKVVIPLVLLALACYAVGFWALVRI
jgi:serine/threonine-protein kinase